MPDFIGSLTAARENISSLCTEVVVIHSNEIVEDVYGGYTLDPSTSVSTTGLVRELSMREAADLERLNSGAQWVVMLPYGTDVSGSDTVTLRDTLLDIVDVKRNHLAVYIYVNPKGVDNG